MSTRGERNTIVPNSSNIYDLQAQTRLRNRGFRLRRNNEPPDETLLARRPLYYIAFLLILFSGILRQPLLFVAGLFVFVLAFIPELWYRYSLRQLSISRQPSTTRAMLGDTIEITLSIENRKPLPLPWFEIVDEIAESLPVKNVKILAASKPDRVLLPNTFSLWAYQRVRRHYSVHAMARGAYRFGPMILRATDPFGILTREISIEEPVALIVHPLVAPLERFGLPALAPFGERKAPRRLLEDPLRISSIRDYIPGDEPRRIHWKATARLGQLQSKVYEPSTSHTLAIFLDIRTMSQALMSYDPSLAELHICAAASVANWAIEQRYAVGVFANGTLGVPEFAENLSQPSSVTLETLAVETPEIRLQREIERTTAALRMRIPPSSRLEQLTHIFDGLARLLPYNGLPMEQMILAEERALPTGATVIYIGTEGIIDVPLIVALRRLKSHGHAVSVLLTQSFQSSEAAEDNPEKRFQLTGLDSHYIGGMVTWEELVGDTLGQDALAFYQNKRRGFNTSPGTGEEQSSVTDSSLKPADSLNSLSGEQKGAGNDPTDQPADNASSRHRPRALVVD